MNIITGQNGIPFDRDLVYYLAGPMTGFPEYNFPAFDKAAKALREAHIKVMSPHEVNYNEVERGSLPRKVYLKTGLQLLMDCTGIILLPGWSRSAGAVAEMNVAHWLEMPMYQYGEGYLVCMSGGRIPT